MTTPNLILDCDGFAGALGEYLEGDASDAVRFAVDAHAQQCAACAALLADLSDIRSSAAALPELTPSRDLWSGISERIDAPVIPMTPGLRQVVRRTWARPAIAAAALVVVTAGVTHYLTRSSLTPSGPLPEQVAVKRDSIPLVGEATATITSSANAPVSVQTLEKAASNPAMARVVSRPVDIGEPVLDREISSLRRIMNERSAQLDPKTIAILEQSMAVIDSAIAQSRAALAKDPASGFLATQLNRSLEKKVELLRTATLLPAGTEE